MWLRRVAVRAQAASPVKRPASFCRDGEARGISVGLYGGAVALAQAVDGVRPTCRPLCTLYSTGLGPDEARVASLRGRAMAAKKVDIL